MVTGTQQQKSATKISLSKLIDLLNECLSREYDRSPTERSTDRRHSGDGEFFGEVCLASQPLHIATATAMTDCTLVKWFEEYPRNIIEGFLVEYTGSRNETSSGAFCKLAWHHPGASCASALPSSIEEGVTRPNVFNDQA